MNESLSLIGQRHGIKLKQIKKRKFAINIKKTFLKVNEKSNIPYCIAILIFIIIILTGILIISLQHNNKSVKINNLRQQESNNYNNTNYNKENITNNYNTFNPNKPNEKDNQKNISFFPVFDNKKKSDKKYSFISKFKKEYISPSNQNPRCEELDPIKMFNSRLNSPSKVICKNSKSQHICYQNKNSIYAGANGVICKMSNIILDPTKWHNGSYTYKGPVDKANKGKPNLSKGFFSMKCNNPNLLEGYNDMYDTYFNGWDYDYKNSNKDIYEELAPGKIVFFLSRNQDSPNLYHGGSEFINALSLMYLLNLDPEDIQVVFLESMTINDDPFYDLYSNLIGRGGKPIYPKNLNMAKKYIISNGIHIPINWDSPCFILSGVPACQYPTLTYSYYNKLIDNYMNITNYVDKFKSDEDIYYYPKPILERHDSNINFTLTITFQWRRVWPKGRSNQQRILGNGPELADKLASVLPKNILLRLIDTASLPIAQQISIMKTTDYFVGIHGAGLTLAIFAPSHCIFHEVLPRNNMNGLLLMASLSGHKTYSDIISSSVKHIDNNEYFYFDSSLFVNKVLSHMKENNLI